ncbi:hypothetical protein C4579_02365, partial [Candidatus Microgenomates bacterium]
DQPPTTYQVTKTLSEGNHTIRMEYYERYVGATAILHWTKLEVQPPPEVGQGNFLAEYFNNLNLNGVADLSREETEINHDWGASSPDTQIQNDNFSARWTTTIPFTQGTYEFLITADDGVRLFIDNELILDKWIDQPPTTYELQKTLSEGSHLVVLEYYERGGGATAQLSWSEVVSEPPPEVSQGSFLAEYFNNISLSNQPVLTREEVQINHDWGAGSPDAAIQSDDFSARWSGSFDFTEGFTKFTVTADDGIRLWLDEQLILDQWLDQPPTTYTVTRNVSAATHTVKLEYYERGGGAVAQLSWAEVADADNPFAISENSFSIVVLPDTQKYAENYPHIYDAQTTWIKDVKDTLNIQFVLHEGDIVEDPLNLTQWQRAKASMDILDGVVGYFPTVGNHDMPNSSNRNTTNYNAYFPYSKFSPRPEFGGVFEANKMDNAYYYFSAGGINFIVLSLEFGPRDAVLDWANSVLESHLDRKAILVTHDYIDDDNTIHGSGPSPSYGPDNPVYGLTDYNTGFQIWEKLVRKHPNLLFTFSGHVHLDDGAGTLVSTGDYGNRVYQMMANYQHYVNGGNGYLRFIEINPLQKLVKVSTYSPYLDQFLTSSTQQFQFDNVTELGNFTTQPLITDVSADNANTITITFNRPMDETSSETVANYSLSPSVNIAAAILNPGAKSVTLLTSDLAVGDYTLTVNNVKDAQGTYIAANSTFDFRFANVTSLTKRIASGSDDAEEFASGEVYLDSSDLELVYEDYFATDQIVGLRFTDLPIPQGATITNAYLQFTTDELNSRTTSIAIGAEISANAASFTSDAQNISTRSKAAAQVSWTIDSWQTIGESSLKQRTPDLTSLLTELVNQPTWQSGNALAFLLSGTGRRVAYSFEGNAQKAPLLFVEWEN